MSPSAGLEAICAAIPSFFTGWAVQVGRIQSEPDKVVAFRDIAGRDPEAVVPVDYPSVQVIVRGSGSVGSYEETFAMAKKVRDALHVIPTAPTAFPELTSCLQKGGIIPLGNDDQDRPTFSINFWLILTLDGTGTYRNL